MKDLACSTPCICAYDTGTLQPRLARPQHPLTKKNKTLLPCKGTTLSTKKQRHRARLHTVHDRLLYSHGWLQHGCTPQRPQNKKNALPCARVRLADKNLQPHPQTNTEKTIRRARVQVADKNRTSREGTHVTRRPPLRYPTPRRRKSARFFPLLNKTTGLAQTLLLPTENVPTLIPSGFPPKRVAVLNPFRTESTFFGIKYLKLSVEKVLQEKNI